MNKKRFIGICEKIASYVTENKEMQKEYSSVKEFSVGENLKVYIYNGGQILLSFCGLNVITKEAGGNIKVFFDAFLRLSIAGTKLTIDFDKWIDTFLEVIKENNTNEYSFKDFLTWEGE